MPKLLYLWQLRTMTPTPPNPPLTCFCTIPLDPIAGHQEKVQRPLHHTVQRYEVRDFFNFIPPKRIAGTKANPCPPSKYLIPKASECNLLLEIKGLPVYLKFTKQLNFCFWITGTSTNGRDPKYSTQGMMLSLWNTYSAFRIFSSSFTPKTTHQNSGILEFAAQPSLNHPATTEVRNTSCKQASSGAADLLFLPAQS